MFDTRTILFLLGGAAAGATALHLYSKKYGSEEGASRKPVNAARLRRLISEKKKLEQSSSPSDKVKLEQVVKELALVIAAPAGSGLAKTFEPS